MKKILAMGASVAMLLSTAAPVFATLYATTTIVGNNVNVKANSGLSTQNGSLVFGGVTQTMSTGVALATGLQSISSTAPAFLGSTTNINANNLTVKANSGLNKQTGTTFAGVVSQGMWTGLASADGNQYITSVAPALLSTTNLIGNNLTAQANSGLVNQTGTTFTGGLSQTMGTSQAQSTGGQWIVSNVQ